jgi:Fis family transcriptional regulator, factor for inversion stimulation protein
MRDDNMSTETLTKLEAATKSPFMIAHKNQPLHESVRQALENYFTQLKGEIPKNLYDLVLAEVEEPLMRAVMEFTNNNQSRAAIVLGLSRGTLRKKLKTYGMLD